MVNPLNNSVLLPHPISGGAYQNEGEYTDEATRSYFGTNDTSPHIRIECLGAVTAKLYQL